MTQIGFKKISPEKVRSVTLKSEKIRSDSLQLRACHGNVASVAFLRGSHSTVETGLKILTAQNTIPSRGLILWAVSHKNGWCGVNKCVCVSRAAALTVMNTNTHQSHHIILEQDLTQTFSFCFNSDIREIYMSSRLKVPSGLNNKTARGWRNLSDNRIVVSSCYRMLKCIHYKQPIPHRLLMVHTHTQILL